MQPITEYIFSMRPIDKNSPYTIPVQIRFTEKQLSEIDEVAEQFEMSRSEIIRLSCSSGLLALKKLKPEGLKQAVARLLTEK